LTGAGARDDFLSGTSGQVFGIRATSRALVADAVCEGAAMLRGQPWRLERAARHWPQRRVLALAIEREGVPNVLPSARRELLRSRHQIQFEHTTAGDRGKFENLNILLARHPPQGHDWLLVIDDDVELSAGFLDRFLFLAERFGLRLAQPAHRHRSHAAWAITRRRPLNVVHQTAFVEIGPLVAFQAVTFDRLLPFPPLRFGWGLDAHWAAIAREHGWPIGVVDATAIRHGQRPIASAYAREDAIAEGREFLAHRPYVRAVDARRTLASHRSWR
jgi:hypothetical protein